MKLEVRRLRVERMRSTRASRHVCVCGGGDVRLVQALKVERVDAERALRTESGEGVPDGGGGTGR